MDDRGAAGTANQPHSDELRRRTVVEHVVQRVRRGRRAIQVPRHRRLQPTSIFIGESDAEPCALSQSAILLFQTSFHLLFYFDWITITLSFTLLLLVSVYFRLYSFCEKNTFYQPFTFPLT